MARILKNQHPGGIHPTVYSALKHYRREFSKAIVHSAKTSRLPRRPFGLSSFHPHDPADRGAQHLEGTLRWARTQGLFKSEHPVVFAHGPKSPTESPADFYLQEECDFITGSFDYMVDGGFFPKSWRYRVPLVDENILLGVLALYRPELNFTQLPIERPISIPELRDLRQKRIFPVYLGAVPLRVHKPLPMRTYPAALHDLGHEAIWRQHGNDLLDDGLFLYDALLKVAADLKLKDPELSLALDLCLSGPLKEPDLGFHGDLIRELTGIFQLYDETEEEIFLENLEERIREQDPSSLLLKGLDLHRNAPRKSESLLF